MNSFMITKSISKKHLKYIIICFIIICYSFSIYCSRSKSDQERDAYFSQFRNNHKSAILISADYIFNNDGLNMPAFIKTNPSTNEIVILDKGNKCFYVFTQEGQFVQKFSRIGQGPGEMMDPIAFDIDYEGTIYMVDRVNNRISIFSSTGEYLNSFRVDGKFVRTPRGYCTIFINNNEEIVVNLPGRGYYFTVFSKDGKILREIGKLQEFNKKHERVNATFGHGYIYVDSKGNYIIILDYLYTVRIYDKNGNFVKELNLDEILGTDEKKYMATPPKGDERLNVSCSIHQILFKEGKIYIMYNIGWEGETFIDCISEYFTQIDKFLINIPDDKLEGNNYFPFDILENYDVLVSLDYYGEVLKFVQNKLH
ncbi:hypothetical protein AMJ80_12185 [bacterium SM23_31]|nr:MAG: hypothetical protein AMJ80_12185 [bacterium SM23_31]